MKNKHISLLLLLFCPAGFLFSQTGISWFEDTTSSYLNNRIIAIKENPEGGLFLLGKAVDGDYMNIHPWWGTCDKSGKLTGQKTLETKNDIHELNNFTICEKDKIRIWGTETVNERYTLMLNTINLKGEMPGSDMMMTNTNTLCGDVCQIDADNAILAKTVQSSRTQKYHISLYQYNVKTDTQVWYKTLDAKISEEATKIFILKDGSIIILGKIYDEVTVHYTSLIYKLNPQGELIWRKEISAYKDFFQQGISEGKDKSLVYVCSTSSEEEITGDTKIFTLDSSGNDRFVKELNDIRANGVLTLKNGNIFIYGSHFQKSGSYVITKASWKIADPAFKNFTGDELGKADAPDATIAAIPASGWPSSSDFLTAVQLSDGRIACGGRLFMPQKIVDGKIIFIAHTNRALLVLMNSEGKFRT